jgi:hypothetical protein
MTIIHAYYGKMPDKRRQARVYEAMPRCGCFCPRELETLDDWSDEKWSFHEDAEDADVEVFVDGAERAQRLAAELRACGMVVVVDPKESDIEP